MYTVKKKEGDEMFEKFEEEDFSLFFIEGLEQRMEELKKQLRPKFEEMGRSFSPELSVITGDSVFPHVAKHARRKTNPPDDSWVAFSTNQRGYKMLPHFQITVWGTHVLVQWGIIYESQNKQRFAENLRLHRDEIQQEIPGNFQWSKDHMKPEGKPHHLMTPADFEEFSERLMLNKRGEVMVGLPIEKDVVLAMTSEDFYKIVLETWGKLNFLHQMAK